MQNEHDEILTPDMFNEPVVPEPLQADTKPAPATATPLAPTTALTPITDISQMPSIWKFEATVEWLIEDFIPLGSVNLITSESGTGKTWVAYAIAGAVARGETFAGQAVRQRPVVYLDGENPLCIAKQRLRDLDIAETPDLHVWGGWVDPSPPGPNCTLIRNFAHEHHPLLIWDSLIEFHPGDEQSAKETRDFMKKFRVLTNAGATVLILHHTGKTSSSQQYRGSSDIKAAVDMAYVLETESTLMGGIHRLTLRNFKSRYAPGKNFGLEFISRRGFVACEVPEKPTAPDPMPVIIEIVAGNPGSNQSQIIALAQRGGISKHQVEKCLKDGPFNRHRGNRNEWLYALAQTPNLPAPKEREIGNLPAPAEVAV